MEIVNEPQAAANGVVNSELATGKHWQRPAGSSGNRARAATSATLRRARAVFAGLACWFDKLELNLVPALTKLGALLVPMGVHAITAGSLLWLLQHRASLPKLLSNKLDEAARLEMLLAVILAFGGLTLLYLLVALLAWRLRGAASALGSVRRLNQLLIFSWIAPLAVFLSPGSLEKESEVLTVAAALGAAGIAALALRSPSARLAHAPEAARSDLACTPVVSTPAVLSSRLVDISFGTLVTLLWGVYAWFFSRLAVTNHHALNTRTLDMGLYNNLFFQSSQGSFLGCSFIRAGYHGSAHFDPFLLLFAPFYLLHPRPEFLLVLQAVWLGSGVIPLYLLTRHKLGSAAAGFGLALAYTLHPALHGMNLYEFHSLVLVTPLLLWLIYFFEREALKAFWTVFALLLLVREDVALLLGFVAIYVALSGRRRAVRTALLMGSVAAGYFVFVKLVFMTSASVFMSGKDAYSFAYYYDALIPNKTGMSGILLSLVTNPVFALQNMLTTPKVNYLLLVFAPLLFLPLLAKRARVMLVYGLAFSLLASRAAVFSVHFQYSAVLLPIAMALAPLAIGDYVKRREALAPGRGRELTRGLVVAIVVCSAIISWKFGAIVDNSAFRGGFTRVARHLNKEQRATYAWVAEQAASIPPTASVTASNKLGPHISSRMRAYRYADVQQADFVFVDEGELKSKDLERYSNVLAGGHYAEVARHNKLVLLRRRTVVATALASPENFETSLTQPD